MFKWFRDPQDPQSDRFPPLIECDPMTVNVNVTGADNYARYFIPDKRRDVCPIGVCRPSILLALKPNADYATELDFLFRDYQRLPKDPYAYEKHVLGLSEYETMNKDKPLPHRLFGRTRNPWKPMLLLGDPRILLHYVSMVCFLYWSMARRYVFVYTGCKASHPPYIYMLDTYNMQFDADSLDLNEPWSDPWTEATSDKGTFNRFLMRTFIHLKLPDMMGLKKVKKFCEFNLAKQPTTFWITRYFSECGIDNLQQYCRHHSQPTLKTCQARYPRNPRFVRVEIDRKDVDASRLPPLLLCHRVLSPHAPILDLTAHASRFTMPLAHEIAIHMVISLCPFLPKTDGNKLMSLLEVKGEELKTSKGFDSPEAQYWVHLSDNTSNVAAARTWIVRLRTNLPAIGHRRRHFGPAFLTPDLLQRMLKLPNTVVLRFGTAGHPDHERHADHYRRLVTLAKPDTDMHSRFALTHELSDHVTKYTQPIAIEPPILKGNNSDQDRWKAIMVTQLEHELLRRLCSESDDDPMDLHSMEQALVLIGHHERCILMTMVHRWRRRHAERLTNQFGEVPEMTDLKMLAVFLSDWTKDVKERADEATKNYYAIENFTGRDLFVTINKVMEDRFGESWNGFDALDSLKDVMRSDVITTQLISHVFKCMDLEINSRKQPTKWTKLSPALQLELGTFVMDCIRSVDDDILVSDEAQALVRSFQQHCTALRHSKKTIYNVTQMAHMVIRVIHHRIIQPCVHFISMMCPRPGPRFDDGMFQHPNPSYMHKHWQFMGEITGIVKREMRKNPHLMDSISDQTFLADFLWDERMGMLHFIRANLSGSVQCDDMSSDVTMVSEYMEQAPSSRVIGTKRQLDALQDNEDEVRATPVSGQRQRKAKRQRTK